MSVEVLGTVIEEIEEKRMISKSDVVPNKQDNVGVHKHIFSLTFDFLFLCLLTCL